MSNVNFYLKGVPSKSNLRTLQKSDTTSYCIELEKMRPVICTVNIEKKRQVIYTKKKVSLKFWDTQKQTVKLLGSSMFDLKDLSDWLKQRKVTIEGYLSSKIINDEYIDVKKVRSFFETKEPEVNSKTFRTLLKDFLIQHKTKAGYKLKQQTEKKYKTLINHIIKFEEDENFFPKKITTEWLRNFISYLSDQRGINDNTVSKYVRSLKTFIKFLRKSGFVIAAELDEIQALERAQVVNIIEQHELEYLRLFKFDQIFLSQIRDLFIFQCYTGQRFSDIQNFQKIDISFSDGRKVWLLSTQKTDEFIVIPLVKIVEDILEKYTSLPTPLPRCSNQHFNRALKEMAKEVGMKRTVKKIIFHNNVKTVITVPLHDLITSHIARKTFISLSLKKKMPERYIRAISGHKSEKSFKAYVNLGNSHLDAFVEAWG